MCVGCFKVMISLVASLLTQWSDLGLAFCVSYALACIFIQIPFIAVLLVGRVLAGISTAILYSAFETWLVSSASSFSKDDLSTILGRATLLNGFVATGAGVFSNGLVELTGSFSTPFIASGALLILAYTVISASWTENFGMVDNAEVKDTFQTKRIMHALKIVRDGMFFLDVRMR